MSRSRVRRQHTAAKTYLRGFADPASQLCMRARDGTVERRNISSASVERDFYTYIDDTGRPTDTVERWLGEEIEDAAAGVLRSLQATPEVRPEWLGILSSFVTSSLLRTATVRTLMDQIDLHTRPLLVLHEQAQKAGVDLAALNDAERHRLLDATRDGLSRIAGDPEEERKARLRVMLRKVDEWTTTIKSWNWEIGRAAASTLITGDAPVVVIGADPLRGWAGVLPADSTVAVPISPTTLLIASSLPLIGTGRVTDQLAAQVNSGLVRNCFKAVFHHPDTSWPSDLTVPARRPTLPEPTINWQPSPPGSTPTFPATYLDVNDATIRTLLDELGATDTVD
jgi:hypothetical protein